MGSPFTQLCTYSPYVHRIWGSSRLPAAARSCFSTGRRLLTFPGRMQVCFPAVVFDCPTLLRMLLTICVS